jgi:hypothetical protein
MDDDNPRLTIPVGKLLAIVAVLVVAGGVSAGIWLLQGGSTWPSSLLAHGPSDAVFLQWTRSGNSVTGSISEAYQSSTDPTQVGKNRASFTGVISGSSITLTFPLGDNWTGTIKGSTVSLTITAADGSLQTLVLKPASLDEYNAAVSEVQTTVQQAADLQAQQQQTQQAEQQVDTDASALTNDLQSLKQATAGVAGDSLADDLSSLSGDLSTVYSDLQTVRSDSSDVVCGDAGVTSGDEGVMEGDQGVMEGDISSYQSDIQSVLDAVSQIKADKKAYETDGAAAPGYSSTSVPSGAEIASAIRAALATVQQERASFKSARSKASQLISQAKGYVSQANAVCNSAGG